MATPLSLLRLMNRATFLKILKPKKSIISHPKRHMLSSAYLCSEAWNKFLQDSSVSNLTFSELAVQIHEQLVKTGKVSRVDINVLAHKFSSQEGDEDEADFLEDILSRFNRCQDSFPHKPSLSHAIVRGYIKAGLIDRLPQLISDRLTYGLFPNTYTLNYIMDMFIKQKGFAPASKVAYFATLQEDFSNHLNALLALEAVTQHLFATEIDTLAPPPKEASDGEEDWVKVKYIHYPFYDDHFDIKDERFLLGKTMMMLSELPDIGLPELVQISLKLIGAGLYHKFDRGLSELTRLADSEKHIPQIALEYFSQSLSKVESRDVDEPEVEIALRTMDDEIHRMLPTHVEKEELLSIFKRLTEMLTSQGRVIKDFSLPDEVHNFVSSNVKKYESYEIEFQLASFHSWAADRDADMKEKVYEIEKAKRIEEMKQQLKEIQKREELLKYFDMEEEIRLKFKEEELHSDPRLTVTKLE